MTKKGLGHATALLDAASSDFVSAQAVKPARRRPTMKVTIRYCGS
jgi:hypothetical protein